MNRKKKFKFTKETWDQFEEELSENEEHMGEMAALLVTCEQWAITEEIYYDAFGEFENE